MLPTVLTSLGAFGAVRDLRAGLAYLAARQVINADRAAAFTAHLEARDHNGSVLATTIVYVATARKA